MAVEIHNRSLFGHKDQKIPEEEPKAQPDQVIVVSTVPETPQPPKHEHRRRSALEEAAFVVIALFVLSGILSSVDNSSPAPLPVSATTHTIVDCPSPGVYRRIPVDVAENFIQTEGNNLNIFISGYLALHQFWQVGLTPLNFEDKLASGQLPDAAKDLAFSISNTPGCAVQIVAS